MTAQGNSPVEGEQSDLGELRTPRGEPVGSGRGGRHRLRAHHRRRARRRPVPRGHARGGAAFFTRRFDALEFEVAAARAAGPGRRADSRRGDRVDQEGRRPARRAQRRRRRRRAQRPARRPGAADRACSASKRREDRARRLEESRARKEEIVAEAEKISQGKDWRNGVNRLRDLLEEWKALPRLDKKLDDELWHRFSSARTAYTRRRKAHFAELNEKREGARVVKQRLLKEAESLSDVHRVGADLEPLPRR